MSEAIRLTEIEMAEVRSILGRFLPPDVKVFVFGSRAHGRLKPWSDLDLSLEGTEPLSWSILADLAEAFDESRLPWKVDLVDHASVSPQFGEIVDAKKLPLDWASTPD